MSRVTNENAGGTQDGQAQAMEAQAPRAGLLQITWRRRGIVAIAVVLCLAGAFVYLLKATPIHMSQARLYVEQTGPRIISEDEGLMAQSKNYLYTQAELLVATPILASAAKEPEFTRMKTFDNIDNVVGFLKRNVEVSVGKKDDIISVTVESPYPEEAAQIVNTIVDSYVSYHSLRKSTTAGEVLKILQGEKTKRETALDLVLKKILKFRRENQTMSFNREGGDVAIERLVRLSNALTDTELELVDATAALATATAMKDTPAKMRQLIAIERQTLGSYSTGNSEEDRMRAELTELHTSLRELHRHCTEEHQDVVNLRKRIKQLETDYTKKEREFGETYLLLLDQRVKAAQNTRTELTKEITAQKSRVGAVNVKSAEYAMMQSELNRNERLCEILDTRIKELSVIEDTGGMNITIREVGKADDVAIKPRKSRIMAMALVAGLMLGVGLALLRDWTDQRLRSVEEVSAYLGVSVLGVVPTIAGKQDTAHSGRKVAEDPTSHTAEAYRTIRTGVYFGAPEGQAKTILVTSPAPGDGKTTMVSNLAIAMAQAGQRVLLVDGDFRKPRIHNVFGLESKVGLSNVLAGRADVSEAIQKTDIAGLHVLPCGAIPPNPSEMLNSQAFLDVIEALNAEYDHIVIDSPPVMPVTDSRILAAICDQTILVLRAEKSTRRAAAQAREGLLSTGGRILGVVINAVPHRKGHYGYYGYGRYGRYGHYGDQTHTEKAKESVGS